MNKNITTTTKEERLKALNNMLEESFDITKVYDDNRNVVLSEIISEIENDNLEITEIQRNEWLKLVIDDARKTCNDFNEPMISLGIDIAIGIVKKHIDELMKRK